MGSALCFAGVFGCRLIGNSILTLAEELSRKSTTPANLEARQRTAISRAYHAAFVSARNYLRDYKKLPLPQTAEAHRDVAQHFRHNAETSNQTIADNLRRLILYRNQADYTDKFPWINSDYRDCFGGVQRNCFHFRKLTIGFSSAFLIALNLC